jgi:hypothetical protein
MSLRREHSRANLTVRPSAEGTTLLTEVRQSKSGPRFFMKKYREIGGIPTLGNMKGQPHCFWQAHYALSNQQ